MKRTLTEAEIARIAEMREAGKTAAVIARRVGCSIGAVNYHCLKLGADAPGAKPLRDEIVGPSEMKRGDHVVRRFTPEDDALLKALALQGFGNGIIARRMGRRWNSVNGRLMTLARREARAQG